MEMKANKAKIVEVKKALSENKQVKTDVDKASQSQLENGDSGADSDAEVPSSSKENEYVRNKLKVEKQKQQKQSKDLKDRKALDSSSSDSEETSSDESDSANTETKTHIENVVGDKSESDNSVDSNESENESDNSSNESDEQENENESKHLKAQKSKLIADRQPQKSSKVDSKTLMDKKNMKNIVNRKHTEENGSEGSDDEISEVESNLEYSRVKGKASEDGFSFDVDDDQELFSVKRNVNLKEFDKVIPVSTYTSFVWLFVWYMLCAKF